MLAAEAKVRYTWDTLSPEVWNWIYNYALAKVKIIEGRIRSKFRDSSSSLVSDGETLVAEGKEEVQNLEQSIDNLIPLNIGVRR